MKAVLFNVMLFLIMHNKWDNVWHHTNKISPLKVDAGAIWSEIPKKDQPGKTEERELIFDFDMNDYDDVRNCCSGKTVCVKCWKLEQL